jgi:hypothetical protein
MREKSLLASMLGSRASQKKSDSTSRSLLSTEMHFFVAAMIIHVIPAFQTVMLHSYIIFAIADRAQVTAPVRNIPYSKTAQKPQRQLHSGQMSSARPTMGSSFLPRVIET